MRKMEGAALMVTTMVEAAWVVATMEEDPCW